MKLHTTAPIPRSYRTLKHGVTNTVMWSSGIAQHRVAAERYRILQHGITKYCDMEIQYATTWSYRILHHGVTEYHNT
jgi:hypothetical protein